MHYLNQHVKEMDLCNQESIDTGQIHIKTIVRNRSSVIYLQIYEDEL